jgi:hypothetical protein
MLLKTEMDAMNFDERQRFCWLAANRVTPVIVELVWIGLIARDIINHETPWFMIAMVPVFAFIRFAAYRIYLRRKA